MLAEKQMLLDEAGLTTDQLRKIDLQAANASFLNDDEKEDLLNHLKAKGDSH